MQVQKPADQIALKNLGVAVRARLAADPTAYKFPLDSAEIYAVGDFLTPTECAKFITMVDASAKPSHAFNAEKFGKYRTSFSGDVDPFDPFVQMISRRIDDFLGLDPSFGETVQGQRYEVGQEFRSHFDWFFTSDAYWPEQRKRGGQRSWTAMIYLNDVAEGGGTEFTDLAISVTPKRGSLLAWNNADPHGLVNSATRHAGLPVTQGSKYIITKWYRTRRWS
ncbi:MAG: hypothetical protein RLY97_868 [Pseudomonadota bacterium]